MTVDFPTFAGNTRRLQRRLDRNAGGNYTQMGALACRERLSLLKAVPGIKPRTGQNFSKERELGPTELYSDSLVILVIRKNIVQQGLICACTLIVVYKVLYA